MGRLKDFFTKKDEKKLEKGLSNTKKSFLSRLGLIVAGKTKISDDFLDELESTLIQSDVGVETTLKLLMPCRQEQQRKNILVLMIW